jgi:hypothetical protein
MRVSSWFSVVTLLVLISFPGVSDAFSRRTSHSEAVQSAPLTTTTNTTQQTSSDGSAQAVPEPPVLWLMSLGMGLFAVGAALRRARRTDASLE